MHLSGAVAKLVSSGRQRDRTIYSGCPPWFCAATWSFRCKFISRCRWGVALLSLYFRFAACSYLQLPHRSLLPTTENVVCSSIKIKSIHSSWGFVSHAICQDVWDIACGMSSREESQSTRPEISRIFLALHSVLRQIFRSTTNQNVHPGRICSISRVPSPDFLADIFSHDLSHPPTTITTSTAYNGV